MNPTQCESVYFIGSTLAPLFACAPDSPEISELLRAFRAMDAEEASSEWPFADTASALNSIKLIKTGLDETVAEDAVWEYRRLFVGPNEMPCPPWGSVYTDPDCVMFGHSTVRLQEWLRKNAIERIADNSTPLDHIATMLHLMAWMAENKPCLLEEYLSDHLLPWVSHYLSQLNQAARHPLYEGVARLAEASFAGMRDELELTIDYPFFYR